MKRDFKDSVWCLPHVHRINLTIDVTVYRTATVDEDKNEMRKGVEEWI